MPNASRLTVGVDTASKTGKTLASGSNTTTLSVTVGSFPDRCLVLCSGNMTIQSATYGGKSFVLGKRSTEMDGSSGEIWYCIAPTIGTANIEITFTGNVPDDRHYIGAINLYNVDQVNPVNTTDDTTAVASSITSSFVPTENNCVAVDSHYTNSTSAGTAGAGQVEIYKRSAGRSGGCSYETDIDATTETMSWSGFSSGSSATSVAVVVFQGAIPMGGGFLSNFL